MNRATSVILAILLFAGSTLTAGSQAKQKIQVTTGARFTSPSLGYVLAPFVPVTLTWTIDNAAQIGSQDLILSKDGGVTFNIKIAAHLPPQQRQLIWGTAPPDATPRAVLELALHLTNGVIEKVFSDSFLINPQAVGGSQTSSAAAQHLAPGDGSINGDVGASHTNDLKNGSAPVAKGAGAVSSEATPAFASPGSCTTAETPVLYYNMDTPTECSSLYGGEPALAQDPTDPNRYFIASTKENQSSEITASSPWAYSGASTVRGLDFGGLASRGDITVEAGADGTVYVTALGQTADSSVPNRILIFRSRDHGSTFEPGVVVPSLETGQFLDKPVIGVNPLDRETLVITYNIPSLSPGTRVVICKQASTGTLSDPNIWGPPSAPKGQYGEDLATQGTTHALIDPIDSTTYRLFVVQTNYAYSPSEAGYAIYQYQLTTGQLTLSNNAILERVVPAEAPSEVDGHLVGAPRWNANSTHQAIEDALRVSAGQSNYTKAAIDYCDPNAHRMYIPTLVDTRSNPNFNGGLSSDLFLTVWQYTGTESVTTKRILPGEGEKYIACAVTDGHGRVWVMPFIIASTTDVQRAQHAVIAINRRTGDPGAIAYSGIRLPANVPNANLFLGDYIYTQASFYPDPNNPGNVNGLGSRVPYETYTDTLYICTFPDFWFRIEISGWN